MKKRLIALVLLGAGFAFGEVSVGIRIGPPPAPRVFRYRPAAPGPDYFWVDGYWYPVGHRYRWHEGYWTRPPYAGAYWVAPRHENGLFFEGYWAGGGRRVDHDHRWDRDHDRDHRDRH